MKYGSRIASGLLSAALALGLSVSSAFATQPEKPRSGVYTVHNYALNASGGNRPAVAPIASYTFPSFNQFVTDTPTAVQLTGAPAGSYNAYNVVVDWSADAGDPFSSEAIWALTNQEDLSGATFHADPGAAPNSQFSGAPVQLHWSGFMDTAYNSPDPLYFQMLQTFGGSSANWDNISVTIGSGVQNCTNFSGDTTGKPTFNRPFEDFSFLSGVGTDVNYEVIPFYVDTDTTYEIENTYDGYDGYMFVYENSFDPNDALTNGVAGNDDGSDTTNGLIPAVQLQAGVQYYFVSTSFDNGDAGAFEGMICSADPFNPGTAFLGEVPEPTCLGLVFGFAVIGLRRRHAA